MRLLCCSSRSLLQTRIRVETGDLLVLPAGIYHRFCIDEQVVLGHLLSFALFCFVLFCFVLLCSFLFFFVLYSRCIAPLPIQFSFALYRVCLLRTSSTMFQLLQCCHRLAHQCNPSPPFQAGTLQAVRIFSSNPKWVPIARPCDSNAARIAYKQRVQLLRSLNQ